MDDLQASPFGGKGARPPWLWRLWEFLTLPFTIHFGLHSERIHPAYGMTRWRRFQLGWRFYRNTRAIWTGTSYRAHLAMAQKVLEIDPAVEGAVVECGCFRGGTTANLSLLCEAVGRELIVYDSFEGLPAAVDGDQYANPNGTGFLTAQLEQVRDHVSTHGSIDVTTLVKGWFSDTLPHHEPPIVLMFLDVDYQASLHDCMLNLWPKLTPNGYCFIDEYVYLDYCALFFSERYWRTYFDRTPPGLMGAGTGVQGGSFYLGPWGSFNPYARPDSIAYTRKNFSGHWDFFPDATGEATDSAGILDD